MNPSCGSCRLLVLTILAAAAACASTATAQSTASAPADSAAPAWVAPFDFRQSRDYFGDEQNVRLLGELLKDEDSSVREQAARDLGQTHNIKAMPLLAQAAKDKSPDVRAAAVAAAMEYGMADFAQMILQALSDEDKTVVLSACRAAVYCQLPQAKDSLVKSMDRPDGAVQLAAIEAMTALKLAAPADKLQAATKSPSVSIRRAVAMNALLLTADQAAKLLADIAVMADKDQPAVREAALAVLGKFALDANRAAIEQARKDANPLVRRGAVEAYRNAAQAGVMKEFLADASPLVRLAAIRGAGDLKAQDAVAGLFEQLQSVEDELSHMAARESLRQIGMQEVAVAAGKMAQEMHKQALEAHNNNSPATKALGEVYPKVTELRKALGQAQTSVEEAERAVQAVGDAKTPEKKAQLDAARTRLENAKKEVASLNDRLAGPASQLADVQNDIRLAERAKAKAVRNLRSCFWLLGQLKSPEQFDMRVEFVKSSVGAPLDALIQVDSTVLIEATESLGLLGDSRATDAMNKLMVELGKQAPLRAMDNPPPNARYNTEVTVATVVALGRLKSAQELASMGAVVDVRIKMAGRLNTEVEAIMKTLPELATSANLNAIETIANNVITDQSYSIPCRFAAALDAGKLGLKKAIPGIRKLLQDRIDRNTMRASAWAIRQLTGETMPVGDPVVTQGQWIITTRQ